MPRLILVLDPDTDGRLDQQAKACGQRRATLACDLLREALGRREETERARRLARDYAAGRGDARKLLADMEAAQFELLGDEDA